MSQVYNKQTGNYQDCTLTQKTIESVFKVDLYSKNSEGKNLHLGTLTVAPKPHSLRVLTIENQMRSHYKNVGNTLISRAKVISQSEGHHGKLSLICQDEGSAFFFYKNGFRFSGDGCTNKNSEIVRRISDSENQLPDDVFLLGDMET